MPKLQFQMGNRKANVPVFAPGASLGFLKTPKFKNKEQE